IAGWPGRACAQARSISGMEVKGASSMAARAGSIATESPLCDVGSLADMPWAPAFAADAQGISARILVVCRGRHIRQADAQDCIGLRQALIADNHAGVTPPQTARYAG